MVRGIGYGRAGRGGVRTTLASMMAAVMLLAFFAGSVAAHTPNVAMSCQYGLKVNLTQYNSGGTNTVSIWIDGVAVSGSPFTFGGSFNQNFPLTDPTVAHAAKVSVYAWDDPTGSKGWTKTFWPTLQACQQPTPTPVPTPTPTPVPTPTPTPVPTPTPTPEPTPTPTPEPTPTPTVEPTPTPTLEPTPTPTVEPTPTVTPEPEVTPTPTADPTPTPTVPPTATPVPTGTVVPATGTPRVTPPATDGIVSDAGSNGPGSGLALVLILLGGASLALLPIATRRSRR